MQRASACAPFRSALKMCWLERTPAKECLRRVPSTSPQKSYLCIIWSENKVRFSITAVNESGHECSAAMVDTGFLEPLNDRPPHHRLDQRMVPRPSFPPWPVLVRTHHPERIADQGVTPSVFCRSATTWTLSGLPPLSHRRGVPRSRGSTRGAARRAPGCGRRSRTAAA